MERVWREKLTNLEFEICRKKGTEAPFSGKYFNFKKDGIFTCKCCGASLFDSNAKFDSGTGWPSFYESVDKDNIKYQEDLTHDMYRIEIACKNCGCHLGHVFDDGPEPTGKRYCVNSISLDFKGR